MESERHVEHVWKDEAVEGILDDCVNEVEEGALDIGEHERIEYVVGSKRGVEEMLIVWEQEDVVEDEQSVGVLVWAD